MAVLKLISGSKSKIDSAPVKDGQFLISTDTKELFYDSGSLSRISFGSSVNRKEFIITVNTLDFTNAKPFVQEINIPGILEKASHFILAAYNDSNEQIEWSKVSKIQVLDNKIIVVCFEEKPNINLNITIWEG